jgi:hypothetical protein
VHVRCIPGQSQWLIRHCVHNRHGGSASGFGCRKSRVVRLLSWECFLQVLTFQEVSQRG